MGILNKVLLCIIAALAVFIGYSRYENNKLSNEINTLNTEIKEKTEKVTTLEHHIGQLKTEIDVNEALISEYKRNAEKDAVEIQALETANKATERKLVFALDKENWSDQKVPATVTATFQ